MTVRERIDWVHLLQRRADLHARAQTTAPEVHSYLTLKNARNRARWQAKYDAASRRA